MNQVSRRHFLAAAAAMGASVAWAQFQPGRSRLTWHERRDLYSEGVASGDPEPHSVLLWTRRPFLNDHETCLQVEVAEDEAFSRVVATTDAYVSSSSDWTARVLVGNLRPSSVYWYRFTDASGWGSRVGRTLTAPADDDPRSVRFAFVSCQNINYGGALNAYRRMIFEDERALEADRLGFVLHLGDFIYEGVLYPEDFPQGVLGRRVRDVVRLPHGEQIANSHVPATVDDYRTLYRTYLHDPDLQDARARWPFVPIWDNHEFSGRGWQSLQIYQVEPRPSQTRKVAANQAWFEYQPARIRKSSGASLHRFDAPRVFDAPIKQFDEHGLGQEPNNLAAIGSLTSYRTLRWGRNVELIITDQHSYRSEEPSGHPETAALSSGQLAWLISQEALEILDAGRAYAHGRAPNSIRFGNINVRNFRRHQPPQTILGIEQKEWFLHRLRASTATWKIWGSPTGTLDCRVDLQNLPQGLKTSWPTASHGILLPGFQTDFSMAYMERAEIYALVRDSGISGFVTVAGDRHSFWAGLAAPALRSEAFEPVGIAFITGAIAAASLADILAFGLPRDHLLCQLMQSSVIADSQPVINMLFRHGVRSCVEYTRTGDADRARCLSNPELAPHLRFLDSGGNGYSTVRASSDALECEFVCIPKPIERANRVDGGPVLYRVIHRAPLWGEQERPQLDQFIVEGNSALLL